MSPERPPSQDSGGGGGAVGVVGISNGSSSVITQVIEPQNMVLSTLSPETSHVITTVSQSGQQHRIITANHQQQQQQQHQTQQIIVNGNSYTAIHSSNSPSNGTNNSTVTGVHHHRLKAATFTSSINGNNANTSPPKYVVFHQNGTSQPTTYIATAQQPAQHQSNGVGNIVVLATEPLDTTNHHHVRRISTAGVNPNGPNHNNTNSGTTDEDLTPLSWLHDKNLINNIVSYSSNGKSVTASPVRQSNNVSNNNNGPLSPTSDFLEDSCVSEDNTSSVNSSSDQGISIHSSDFSPTTTASNSSFVGVHHHNHHHQQQQHQQQIQVTQYQQNGYPVHHHIQYTNGNSASNNNNNNNNSTIKNRNHILSPSSSSSSTSSQIGVQDSNIITSTGPTTTLHVGPSGTTTVVEYKAGTNFIPATRCQIPSSSSSSQQSQQQILPSSPQRTTPPSATNTVYVHHTNATTNHQVTPTSSTTTTSSISTPTKTYHQQHFHKKYLREQMNGFDQNNFNNSSNTTNNVVNRATINVVTSDNRDQASPIASPNNNSHQNSKLTTNDQPLSAGDIKEYHYSPIKTVPTTVSYSATNESQDDLIKEGINFDSQQNGVGSSSSKIPPSSKQTAPSPKQKQSTNSPYDPRVHTHTKPPYSFSSLIFMAIEDSPEKALPVKEIYAWIVQHFPYFKTAPTGWKNSVRHNLSLNKSFLKVEKAPNMGKGSLWRVEQNQRPNLIQALTRSPFFPRTLIDKVSPQLKSPISNSNNRGSSNVNNSINPIIEDDSSADRAPMKSLDAKLFPKLSKMIKEMVNKGNYTSNNQNSIGSGSDSAIEQDESHYDNQQQQIITYNGVGSGGVLISNGDVCCNSNGMMVPTYEAIERLARDCGADNDDVNAAAAMLALKHGPKVFSETFANGSPVITSSPSEDHTYSAGNGGSSTGNNSINPSENNSNCNSSDGAYDSREGSPVHHYHQYHHHHHHNDQQQQQHQENVGYHQIVTAEELEEQRRHAEGVDALLSFASKVSSMTSSGASSPVKRPSSTSPSVTEDEHISYAENIPTAYTTITTTMNDDVESPPIMNGIVIGGGGGGRGVITQHQQHTITGPGQTTTTVMIATAAATASTALPSSSSSTQKHTTTFNSDGYYNHLLSPSPAKKLKTSRNLRTKIKRKATWIR